MSVFESSGEPYTLGPERRKYFSDNSGFYMRFNRDIKKSVVFLGYPEYGAGPTKVHFQGTGFLLGYEDYFTYMVTARHVAALLTETCAARVNTVAGKSINVIGENLPWTFHPDPTVDVAVVNFQVPPQFQKDLDIVLIPPDMILTQEMAKDNEYVELGDVCYTVGLFRVLTGEQRNLPVIHTGNLARMAGEELIALKDPSSPTGSQLVDGHLVEAQSLSGLSGSPVFIRQSVHFAIEANRIDSSRMSAQELSKALEAGFKQATQDKLPKHPLRIVVYSEDVFLLGIWQAAWEAPAGEVIAIDRGKNLTVPVGMGVVVPASKIVEVLELPKMKAARDSARKQHAEETAATPQAIRVEPASASHLASDENPNHQEDFTRLVGAAARKPPQED